MRRIYPGIHVGPMVDYRRISDLEDWAAVRAGPEFYPSEDATLASPPIRQGRCLFLYLPDAVVEIDIPRRMYEEAIEFIDENLSAGRKVLIHCNQGVSRSASIGFLYLAARTRSFEGLSLQEALSRYEEIYPPVSFGKAIRSFVAANWEHFAGGSSPGHFPCFRSSL